MKFTSKLLLLSVLLAFASIPFHATEKEESTAAEPAVEATQVDLDLSLENLEKNLLSPKPGVQPKGGTCQAQFDCKDGNIVSCNGTYSCGLAGRWGFTVGVKCNNQETLCPNLCNATRDCSSECGSPRTSFCYSTTGDCTPYGCNGYTLQCHCPEF